ncbi:MAG: hypothetical protein Q8K01_08635, partial [Sulfurimicrobium sp.]|nr:hypothetical protein [Sulfurimicrobium sp.]
MKKQIFVVIKTHQHLVIRKSLTCIKSFNTLRKRHRHPMSLALQYDACISLMPERKRYMTLIIW